MVIDLILDRKGGEEYRPLSFYVKCRNYEHTFGTTDTWGITRAMDYDDEKQVKRALCNYIKTGGYNPDICRYVNSVSWLGEYE